MSKNNQNHNKTLDNSNFTSINASDTQDNINNNEVNSFNSNTNLNNNSISRNDTNIIQANSQSSQMSNLNETSIPNYKDFQHLDKNANHNFDIMKQQASSSNFSNYVNTVPFTGNNNTKDMINTSNTNNNLNANYNNNPPTNYTNTNPNFIANYNQNSNPQYNSNYNYNQQYNPQYNPTYNPNFNPQYNPNYYPQYNPGYYVNNNSHFNPQPFSPINNNVNTTQLHDSNENPSYTPIIDSKNTNQLAHQFINSPNINHTKTEDESSPSNERNINTPQINNNNNMTPNNINNAKYYPNHNNQNLYNNGNYNNLQNPYPTYYPNTNINPNPYLNSNYNNYNNYNNNYNTPPYYNNNTPAYLAPQNPHQIISNPITDSSIPPNLIKKSDDSNNFSNIINAYSNSSSNINSNPDINNSFTPIANIHSPSPLPSNIQYFDKVNTKDNHYDLNILYTSLNDMYKEAIYIPANDEPLFISKLKSNYIKAINIDYNYKDDKNLKKVQTIYTTSGFAFFSMMIFTYFRFRKSPLAAFTFLITGYIGTGIFISFATEPYYKKSFENKFEGRKVKEIEEWIENERNNKIKLH